MRPESQPLNPSRWNHQLCPQVSILLHLPWSHYQKRTILGVVYNPFLDYFKLVRDLAAQFSPWSHLCSIQQLKAWGPISHEALAC